MLSDKKLFLFDIDGTIAQGPNLIDGTMDLLQAISACGGKSVFITNNSTKSNRDYIRSFRDRWGIETDESSFVTATTATLRYLQQHHAGRLVYVMGTESFRKELSANGIRVTTDCGDPCVDCVLVAYDGELTYQKLVDVCRILSTRQVDYLATNPDLVCPTEFGFIPDCGSMCQMIGHAVKRDPVFIGKPEPGMVEMALSLNHYTKDETLVVGDRMYTDILCGVNAGVETALVLTGEATREEEAASPYHADYIFPSVRELLAAWKG